MITRRSFLKGTMGGAAALACSPTVAAASPRSPTVKRVVILWMAGGPSQIDTFDPKPGEPSGGPFGAVESAVSGIRLSEHLRKTGERMDDLAIIRSMRSTEGNHVRARHLLHTGYAPAGSTVHPLFGAVAAEHLSPAETSLPPFVCIGARLPGGASSPRFLPYSVRDPMSAREGLDLCGAVSPAERKRRLRILESLEGRFEEKSREEVSRAQAMRTSALALMRDPKRRAFDLSEEWESARPRYGDTPIGQAALLARRLLEAGVSVVEVVDRGWDTHKENFERVAQKCHALDPAMSSLLGDLSSSGLLSETLFVWAGEFGRSPTINGDRGRGHYPSAFSVVLGGGAVRGGQVIGATSNDGSMVSQRPVGVADLFATLYALLGFDENQGVTTDDGRPLTYVPPGGKVIRELM